MLERVWVYLSHLLVTPDESCVIARQDNSSRSIVDAALSRKFRRAFGKRPQTVARRLDRFLALRVFAASIL